MMRFTLALAILVAMPAFAADDEDVLDSAAVATEYPTLIKRAEKRDGQQELVCGIVIRCKLPNEKECRIQYKSELATDGIYSVVYGTGTSQVKRGKNGSLE